MVSIRLSRVGKKNHPQFRIVVQEKARDPYGPALEIVGFYDPNTSPSTLQLKEEQIKDWISKGAQPSNTVWNLLLQAGLVNGKKRKSVAISNKRRGKAEAAAEASEEPAEVPATKKEEEAPAKETETAPQTPVEEPPKEKEETAEATPGEAQKAGSTAEESEASAE